MATNPFTRRDFLKSATCGLSASIALSQMSPARAAVGTKFDFVQLCDTQLGFGGYEDDIRRFKQAVTQINTLKPDFVVICGDLVNTANEKSYADFNRIRADFQVPCYCVAGNHDVGNHPSVKSLNYYRKVIGEDYYSFEHKGYTFAMVNSQLWKSTVEKESEKHDAWLCKTLAAASKTKSPVCIVGHYPLFLKQANEEEEYMNLPKAKRLDLLKLFTEHGVVAVLGGHTHRLVINDYQDAPFVNGETTSKNFDQRPFGFRHWHVSDSGSLRHEFVPLKED